MGVLVTVTQNDNNVQRRFWKHVEKSENCWVWKGWKHRDRYGLVRINKRMYMAHRIAYQMSVGPIPEGMLVCHRCDNPPCVRPDHLFLGTDYDNQQDAIRKGRIRNYARGERQWRAKLTQSQVDKIRAKYIPRKYSTHKLAIEYGVNQQTIWAIIANRTWRRY